MEEEYKVSSELYEETNNITDIKPTASPTNVVSVFKFTNPSSIVDSDGDLVVKRKPSKNDSTEKDSIQIEHSTSTILDLVGLQIWRGAFLLADWLIYNNKDLPKDGVILELGSGVGLTSIIAAMYRNVICTDIDQGGILNLISENVKRNKSLTKHQVSVLKLDFLSENFTEEIEVLLPKVKIILAADVIYDDMITQAFVATLQKLLLKCPQCVVYIALEKRYVFTVNDCDTCAPCYEYFLECLEKVPKINSELLPLDFGQYFEYDRVKELVLWKITSK
nr:methyltransferase-like protein 22 [Onthophagus taurus]XP_022918159.1 methyltransferase-like protein 22 [Onthophagus taurus]